MAGHRDGVALRRVIFRNLSEVARDTEVLVAKVHAPADDFCLVVERGMWCHSSHEQNGTRGHFDGNRTLWKVLRGDRQIPCVAACKVPDDSLILNLRDDPDTSVVDRGIDERDPARDHGVLVAVRQGIAGVLMPWDLATEGTWYLWANPID